MVTRTSELPPMAAESNVRKTTELPEAEENYQYEQPIGPQQRVVNPNQYASSAGPTREDYEAEKKRKFDEEQEKWNKDYEEQRKRHDYEREEEKFEKQQKAEVESKTEKSFQGKVVEKAKGAASAGWGRLKKNISAPAQRADDIRNRNTGQLTKADLNRALSKKKGRESKGQFKQPRYGSPFGGGGKVSGTFPDIDPFGGMGGKGRNMLDLSFGGMGQRPQQQQPQRQAPPRPKPQPMRFPDPFAGLKKSSGNSKQSLKVMGKGLGTGRKEGGKKLKKMKDWFDF